MKGTMNVMRKVCEDIEKALKKINKNFPRLDTAEAEIGEPESLATQSFLYKKPRGKK